MKYVKANSSRYGVAAQPGVAADRFAREIVVILKAFYAARSRQLNANPFGGVSKPFHILSCCATISAVDPSS